MPVVLAHVLRLRRPMTDRGEDPTMTDQSAIPSDRETGGETYIPLLRSRVAAPTPRQEPCTHPVRARTSLDGNTVRETCRLCDAHLVTNRQTGRTTVEVTG